MSELMIGNRGIIPNKTSEGTSPLSPLVSFMASIDSFNAMLRSF